MTIKTHFIGELSDFTESGEVVNIEIHDPREENQTLCVGFTYKGSDDDDGDRRSPDNYEYDHTNLWPENASVGDEKEISREELEDILQKYQATIRSVLEQCLQERFTKK